jgi:hypothetical protein
MANQNVSSPFAQAGTGARKDKNLLRTCDAQPTIKIGM